MAEPDPISELVLDYGRQSAFETWADENIVDAGDGIEDVLFEAFTAGWAAARQAIADLGGAVA